MNLQTRTTRTFALLLTGGVAAGTVLVPPLAAWANPAGCNNTITGSTSSTGLLKATAGGTCSGVATRTMRAEIKQDIPARQDPLLAANEQNATTKNYSVTVTSCDNGNRATYYGRGFFTVSQTQRDTPHTVQTTCG